MQNEELIEIAKKIAEVRNVGHQEVTSIEKKLEEYEEVVKLLEEELEVQENLYNANKQILWINSYEKKSMNRYYTEFKELFTTIYNYLKHIDETLSNIESNNPLLKNRYAEKENLCSNLETDYTNNLKRFVISEKQFKEKINEEKYQQQDATIEVKNDIKVLNDEWNHLLHEQERQHNILEKVKLEQTTIFSNLQSKENEEKTVQKQVQEECEKTQLLMKEIWDETCTLNKKIGTTSDEIQMDKNEIAKNLEMRQHLYHQENNLKHALQSINKECCENEKYVKDVEEKLSRDELNLKNQVEKNLKIRDEKDAQLSFHENQASRIASNLDQWNNKLNLTNEECNKIKVEYECSLQEFNTTMEENNKLSNDNTNSDTDLEKLTEVISSCEAEIIKKKAELEKVKCNKSSELSAINEEIKNFQTEYETKKYNLEEELQKLEIEKEDFLKVIEQLEFESENCQLKHTNLESEIDKNRQVLKDLTLQCENISNEIKRCEYQNENETKKPTPTPSLKRYKRKHSPHGSTSRNMFMDDSESSIDGEKLSYDEFIARKRIMKESRSRLKK